MNKALMYIMIVILWPFVYLFIQIRRFCRFWVTRKKAIIQSNENEYLASEEHRAWIRYRYELFEKPQTLEDVKKLMRERAQATQRR